MCGLISRIDDALTACGLMVRGAVALSSEDRAPNGPSGMPARSVVLVGHGGADYWPHFERWRSTQTQDLANPLDAWSRSVLEEVASLVGARALLPNDRPYAPFQQWAIRAERLCPSPIGLLIHPVYGLWHAFRGALLFDAEIEIQQAEQLNHPCDVCVGKPCMNACPVSAFTAAGFAYERCLVYVREPQGQGCRTGCQARNACPIGIEYRYPASVQTFHQAAFAGL